MCGIAGIVYSSKYTDSFDWSALWANLDALRRWSLDIAQPPEALIAAVEQSCEGLREYAPWATLWNSEEKQSILSDGAEFLKKFEQDTKQAVTEVTAPLSTSLIESWNSLWVRLRDIAWTINNEVLASLGRVKQLMPERYQHVPNLNAWKIAIVLGNIGRLEVRGRDSLGIGVEVHYTNAAECSNLFKSWANTHANSFSERLSHRDLRNYTIRYDMGTASPSLLFIYKTAKEIGALGDNVNALRQYIRDDELLWEALSAPNAQVNVWSHTRWASNGIISEPNCHPVDELCYDDPSERQRTYWIAAACNGDVDNVRELAQHLHSSTGQRIAKNITCDTKIIPVLVNFHYQHNANLCLSFCQAVSECEGSAAVVMQSSLDPDHIYLSLKGSGQSLFIGLCENGYTFASELYGVVEQTARFIRLDGTHEAVPGKPETAGQVFVLSLNGTGLKGLQAYHLDGSPLAISEKDIRTAEITTRDIDRGEHKHYLLKEINESPQSVTKTLLGKIFLDEKDHSLAHVNLGSEVFPPLLKEKFLHKEIKRIRLIGQGTAAIAAAAIASMLGKALLSADLDIRAVKATELSGYALEEDMADTLIIAVSQSGTTTDTNRTIDLVRARKAIVIGIVNRRNSDLVYKVDGVLYTSDGRDIEMSVASTKAFYSQVAAGYLIGLYIADFLQTMSADDISRELKELQNLPQKMSIVLSNRELVHNLAKKYATTRHDWAVVGSGPTRAAADEIRIKLSELCYKSIATDYIEDKKHIDLSSEPLTIICAAGLPVMALRDAVKEVSIFKSHKSIPIVICSEGFDGFEGQAAGIIYVPNASTHTSVLLNTLVGHLWGYYCAMTINDSADPLRVGRAISVEHVNSGGLLPTQHLMKQMLSISRTVEDKMGKGEYNSSMSVDVAMRVAHLLPYFTEGRSLRQFYTDFKGKKDLIETIISVLSEAIQELSRPIDAIKHQAKTITVGISRSQELLEGPVFTALAEADVSAEDIPYRDLAFIKALSLAIDHVVGTTVYAVKGLNAFNEVIDSSTIQAVKKTGLASSMRSRSDQASPIVGTKQWVVNNKRSYVGHGRNDRRPILIIPIMKDGTVMQIALLHLTFVSELNLAKRVEMIKNLTNRYGDLKSQIEETNIIWKDEFLTLLSVEELATLRAAVLAELISKRLNQ
ncbi:MAG: SIS domain-containing protein [bacterium]|nr:SIS domain-containing protein [bacterium]